MLEPTPPAFPRTRLLWAAGLVGIAAVAIVVGFAIGNTATLEELGPVVWGLALAVLGLALLVAGAVVGALGIDGVLAWLVARGVRGAAAWRTVRWVLPLLGLVALVAALFTVLADSRLGPLGAVVLGLPWLSLAGTAVALLVQALRAARRPQSRVSASQPASGR